MNTAELFNKLEYLTSHQLTTNHVTKMPHYNTDWQTDSEKTIIKLKKYFKDFLYGVQFGITQREDAVIHINLFINYVYEKLENIEYDINRVVITRRTLSDIYYKYENSDEANRPNLWSRKDKLSKLAYDTYGSIAYIITRQQLLLESIITDLEIKLEFLDKPTSNNTNEKEIAPPPSQPKKNSEKAIINLSKKHTVLLFFLLKESGILDFNNFTNSKLARLIEDNFTYIEQRKVTDGTRLTTKQLQSVAVELSRLTDYANYSRNTKSQDKLIKHIDNLTEECLNRFSDVKFKRPK